MRTAQRHLLFSRLTGTPRPRRTSSCARRPRSGAGARQSASRDLSASPPIGAIAMHMCCSSAIAAELRAKCARACVQGASAVASGSLPARLSPRRRSTLVGFVPPQAQSGVLARYTQTLSHIRILSIVVSQCARTVSLWRETGGNPRVSRHVLRAYLSNQLQRPVLERYLDGI